MPQQTKVFVLPNFVQELYRALSGEYDLKEKEQRLAELATIKVGTNKVVAELADKPVLIALILLMIRVRTMFNDVGSHHQELHRAGDEGENMSHEHDELHKQAHALDRMKDTCDSVFWTAIHQEFVLEEGSYQVAEGFKLVLNELPAGMPIQLLKLFAQMGFRP